MLLETEAGQTLPEDKWCEQCKHMHSIDGRVCVVWADGYADQWKHASTACAGCMRTKETCTLSSSKSHWDRSGKDRRPARKPPHPTNDDDDDDDDIEHSRSLAGFYIGGRIRGG